MKAYWNNERIKESGGESKKLGRVLERHILLLYQYVSVYNKFSFDTQVLNFLKLSFRMTGHPNFLELFGFST